MNDQLNVAAENGNIDQLYTVFETNPHILEQIDEIPFVETPLHVAAIFGHLEFAAEIMRLRPSFAWKLNPQGLSPIHLALQHGQKSVVFCLIDIDNDLCRVKDIEGLTLLHLVSRSGEVDLLAYFLAACPESIKDVTDSSETALHIAVVHQQHEALQILLQWLKRTWQRGAMKLEKNILNWKNEAGNDILHLAAFMNDLEALHWLIQSKINLNQKNKENKTALDIASNAEMKSKLIKAGAKHGSSVIDAPTLVDQLKVKTSFVQQIIIFVLRMRNDISKEERNALLVVAVLVAICSYINLRSLWWS